MSGPKHIYGYIVMETNDVNHTALFTAAEKTGTMTTDSFRRLYLTAGGRDKDLGSREHDEVISRTVPILGFSVTYRELQNKTRKRRFAIIYKRINTTTEPDAKVNLENQLQDFYKHYRRHVGEITVQYVPNINNLEIVI
jgi:hypothetical protein